MSQGNATATDGPAQDNDDMTSMSRSPLRYQRKRKRADSSSEAGQGSEYDIEQPGPEKDALESNRLLPDEKGCSSRHLCFCQPNPKIPRPRNAFILFRQHHQANVIAQYPGLSNPEISKLLGEKWNNSTAEVKNEWKQRAEAEKQRHMQQHPDYKYQPKRYVQGRPVGSSEHEVITSNCQKCRRPSSPILNSQTSTRLASMDSSSKQDEISYSRKLYEMPPPSIPSSPPSKQRTVNSNFRPQSIAIPPPGQQQSGNEQPPLASKRRRYTNVPTSASFILPTPYRNSFAGRHGPDQARQWGPLSAGSIAAPGSSMKTNPGSSGQVLMSPNSSPETPNVEQYIASIPVLLKVFQLSRISPPYKSSVPAMPNPTPRGASIAIEGDNQRVVGELVKWLENYLMREGEYYVKTAQGPLGPKTDETASIADYLKVIADWQAKSEDIIAFITRKVAASAHSDNEEIPPEAPSPATLTPVILLQRFQLFAANTYAVHIPIRDTYKPLEHWQWMASLWRGTVGPDITICIKDVRSEDLRKDSRLVEIQEELGVVIVKREAQYGLEASSQMNLDESTLRRLGFEISELIRSIRRPSET